ncbi:MAG TPA: LysM peptidoglycan-binding domain-containing protein [Bacteroidia bacterium]|nr:LysM peptidoglycan-binding domain-containing protein [Bacteroidia bacterium]
MMRILFAVIALLLSFSVSRAGNDTIIRPELSKIQHAENLAGSMKKLKAVHSTRDSAFVVAHFGDSHIQGDYFSGQIRYNMQEYFRYGGEGILFPYSVCKSFGPKNLTTTIAGTWEHATVLNNAKNYPIGITGYTLVTTDKKATISFNFNPQGGIQYNDTTIIKEVVIWHSADNFKLLLKDNKSAGSVVYDEPVNGLQCTRILNYRIGTELKLYFDVADAHTAFNFHGIAFENPSEKGLEYHRCGVVGATFLQLIKQQDVTLAHLKQIKPDLLIFSYGSNESYDTNFNVDNYYTQVSAFIKRVKDEIPGVNIVFTGTPDTRSRSRYPVNTIPINTKLNLIAQEQGCGFWDMNAVMGGDNSILYWLENGLARKDKLHFTKSGYGLQADLFSAAFFNLYHEQYDEDAKLFCTFLDAKIASQLKGLKDSPKPAEGEKQPVGTGQTHVVKQGETLSVIARNYGVTVQQICDWNNISKTAVLHIGQKLIIKK